ncbi:adenine-N(1)--methyltransferas-like protein catalytic subunit trm61 [Calycina marina]|uniref:tRNA (adenine(58)-N(1))-methyltransferase catalytic subunit TRM61 n=1 Tax=Calycina marina TaxID=1763456 RepID=A0A9P7Z4U7_9HELO|nr:adenine-N(1)--methyltransferas-like protein catalytic subunit trm61 [Calycina marina]
MTTMTSPFLFPDTVAQADKLAIVHLRRDLQIPTILKEHDEDDEGYAEGKVVNTRFGSFPHKTLIGKSWGSQILASKVDTGSRGRRDQKSAKKQKKDNAEGPGNKRQQYEESTSETPRKKLRAEDGTPVEVAIDDTSVAKEESDAVAAQSGFVHLLAPTPENWTSSLPHRTQVVYTPDYSYVLHRLKVRPGAQIIEVGAGSGSFTHASARAVFHGYPGSEEVNGSATKRRKLGKVWSYEFHEQRHEKLQKEIEEHGLDGIVEITHRDVCENGFLVNGESPEAEAIFLDLPAPWLALPHLVRSKAAPFVSPLNPSATVHLCTFSPCIEQVQKTMSVMRQLGWVDIEMVAIAHKRFEIRRERIGIDNGSQRGLQSTPASVDEALQRLLEVEGNFKVFHENGTKVPKQKDNTNPNNRAKIIENLVEKKVYKEGKLVHRTEPEVKNHTSYLTFAILPQEWTAEDEARVCAELPIVARKGDCEVAMSSRAMRKAAAKAVREKAEAAKSRRAVAQPVISNDDTKGSKTQQRT